MRTKIRLSCSFAERACLALRSSVLWITLLLVLTITREVVSVTSKSFGFLLSVCVWIPISLSSLSSIDLDLEAFLLLSCQESLELVDMPRLVSPLIQS